MEGRWNVTLQDGNHIVYAELNPLSSRLSVFIDNASVHSSFVWTFVGNIGKFDWRGHLFIVSVKGLGIIAGKLALTVDGLPIARAAETAPAPAVAPPASIQFVGEQDVVETTEVFEELPIKLDNTNGNQPVERDKAIEKTIHSEVTTQTNIAADLKATGNVLQLLQLDASAHLSSQVGQTLGETLTVRDTLHMSAGPNSSVVYVVSWKRRIRTGKLIYLINGSTVAVPYRITYGLDFDVSTRKEGS